MLEIEAVKNNKKNFYGNNFRLQVVTIFLDMAENKYDEVKKLIRSLLISYPTEVSLRTFTNDYAALVGKTLPTKELGYCRDIDLLQSMPDVVRIVTDNTGKHKLFGIADESSVHIQKLVLKQRSKARKVRINSKHYATTVHSASKVNYEPLFFVPGGLRSEINALMRQYQNGISIPSFVLAYEKRYNKKLPVENGIHGVIRLIITIPEFEIREVNNEKRIFPSDSNMPWKKPVLSMKDKASNMNSNDVKDLKNDYIVDTSGISEKEKENFRTVLDKCPNGILASHFPPLYEKIIKKEFDLHTFGYTTLSGLVVALPEIFKWKLVPDLRNEWILYPAGKNVEDRNVSPVAKSLVDFQKKKYIQNVQKLLTSHPEGISLKMFLQCYKDTFNASLSFLNLGYGDLETYLSSIAKDVPLKLKSHEGSVTVHLQSPFSPEKSTVTTPLLSQEKLNPDGIASPTCQFPEKDIHCHLDKYVRVFVSALIDPSLFWFQLHLDDDIHTLDTLEAELGSFYGSQQGYQYRMKNDDIVVGAACIAFNPVDKFWFRAIIESIPTYATVKVLYVDYGDWEEVLRSNLRYIRKSFMTVPVQAHKARLSSMKPANNQSDWSTEARKKFVQLCQHMLFAEIVSIKDKTASVFLCDTSGGKETHINDVLIDEGFSDYCPEDNFACNRNSIGSPAVLYDSSRTSVDSIGFQKQISEGRKSTSSLKQNGELFQDNLSYKQENDFTDIFIKKINLGDGYKANVIYVNNKLYISGGDLCALFWKGRNANYLAQLLKSKDIIVPTFTVSKDSNTELFHECVRNSLSDIQSFDLNNSSIVLYPLTHVVKILNAIGHPSLTVRESILKAVRSSDIGDFSSEVVSEDEFSSDETIEDSVNKSGYQLEKMCLNDLTIMLNKLEDRRIKKLQRIKSVSSFEDINKIENLQTLVREKIAEITEVCSTYSAHE